MLKHNIDFDLLGIGIGPANLSLAALVEESELKNNDKQAIFIDEKSSFTWHQGQMFPESVLLSEFYRDLVTPAIPTSKFSFINYLHSEKRLADFFASGTIYPERYEFQLYCSWICNQLPSLEFGVKALSISFDRAESLFRVSTHSPSYGTQILSAKNICLGVGRKKYIPEQFATSNRAIHVSELVNYEQHLNAKKILVVGSGQSAAECIYYLLTNNNSPSKLCWVSRNATLFNIDESPLTAEAFTESYPQKYYEYPINRKKVETCENVRLLCGVAPETSRKLSAKLYSLKVHGRFDDLISIKTYSNAYPIDSNDKFDTIGIKPIGSADFSHIEDYDLIILATGFDKVWQTATSLFDNSIKVIEEPSCTDSIYSLKWNGPSDRRIFLQSASETSHGITDNNYVMAPLRNKVILKALHIWKDSQL